MPPKKTAASPPKSAPAAPTVCVTTEVPVKRGRAAVKKEETVTTCVTAASPSKRASSPSKRASSPKASSPKARAKSPAAVEVTVAVKEKKPRKPRTKKEKIVDPNKKKRAPSSFIIFSNEHRAKVRSENPDLKITEIGKILGTMWKGLSDAQKKPYVDQNLRLKEALA